MNNELLEVLEKSFDAYLTDGARSNSKLKFLHEKISFDIENKINELNKNVLTSYKCYSLNTKNGKEKEVFGRYMPKKIVISICKNDKIVAGAAVKFVMSNFKQNKNNYFENMLGETANIRSNNIPYYQIFIIFDRVPYYDKYGNIIKWENLKSDDIKKYLILTNDNNEIYFHAPDKMFLGIISIEYPDFIDSKFEFNQYFESNLKYKIKYSKNIIIETPNNLILNNYEEFITKICHHILSF